MIHFSHWKILSPDVETQILHLREVIDVMVLGVVDEECNERVAAILRLSAIKSTEDQNVFPNTLEKLRRRLSEKEVSLPLYKQPTLLRLLKEDEHIPTTSTGKPSKRLAREQYFPADFVKSGQVHVCEVNIPAMLSGKLWDWTGTGL